MRGQDEYRYGGQTLAGDVGQRPVLFGFAAFALPQIIEMGRCREEVGGNQGDHVRIAATVLPQIDDEGIDVGQKIHSGNGRVAANPRIGEEIKLQIANLAA